MTMIKNIKGPILYILFGISVLLTQFVNCGEPLNSDLSGGRSIRSLDCDPDVEECPPLQLELKFTAPDGFIIPWIDGGSNPDHYEIEVGGNCNVGTSDNHVIMWEAFIGEPRVRVASTENILNVCAAHSDLRSECKKGKFFVLVPLVGCAAPNFNFISVPSGDHEVSLEATIYALDGAGDIIGSKNSNTHEMTLKTKTQ